MNMFKLRELLGASFAMAIMSGGCVGAEPDEPDEPDEPNEEEAEFPSAAECVHGANGFIDISDSLSGTVRRSVPLRSGVRITLESGTVAGAERGWAKLSGSTAPGDRVWMDWTRNGGATWLQCGPFSVSRRNQSITSAAKVTSPSSQYMFRACGDRPLRCTGWW